jgi:hypothetical protein
MPARSAVNARDALEVAVGACDAALRAPFWGEASLLLRRCIRQARLTLHQIQAQMYARRRELERTGNTRVSTQRSPTPPQAEAFHHRQQGLAR